jgi:antagonist of KipI
MSVIVEKAGMLDSIQDGGRHHWAHLGISTNGPMDWYAHELANALVGNRLDAPVVEMHFPASTLRFTRAAIISITGADWEIFINGRSVVFNRTLIVEPNDRLLFGRKNKGERAYLAIHGKWKIASDLGSASTDLKSKLGGLVGKKLMAGDQVDFEPHNTVVNPGSTNFNWYAEALSGSDSIGVLPGPEWHWLSKESKSRILSQPFLLKPNSDRMALNWEAPPLQCDNADQMVSSAVTFGTIQLLPNGNIVTLMADHQTVGGYPRILQVVRADLPKLAQLSPGSKVHFQLTDLATAIAHLAKMKSHLQQVASAVRLQMALG